MTEGKKLNAEFETVQRWEDARYVVYDNDDVELLIEYDTPYPILSSEEILKLAKIVKEE